MSINGNRISCPKVSLRTFRMHLATNTQISNPFPIDLQAAVSIPDDWRVRDQIPAEDRAASTEEHVTDARSKIHVYSGPPLPVHQHKSRQQFSAVTWDCTAMPTKSRPVQSVYCLLAIDTSLVTIDYGSELSTTYWPVKRSLLVQEDLDRYRPCFTVNPRTANQLHID